MDANENAASLPQAERESSDGRMFIGSWEHVASETHNQRLGDQVAGDGYLGLDESMDITTVNEQGVQCDFTDVEMRRKAFRKISSSWEHIRVPVEIERELESDDTERER